MAEVSSIENVLPYDKLFSLTLTEICTCHIFFTRNFCLFIYFSMTEHEPNGKQVESDHLRMYELCLATNRLSLAYNHDYNIISKTFILYYILNVFDNGIHIWKRFGPIMFLYTLSSLRTLTHMYIYIYTNNIYILSYGFISLSIHVLYYKL